MNKGNIFLYGIIVVLLIVIAFMAGRLSNPTPVVAADIESNWVFQDAPGGLICATFNGEPVGCYCPCDNCSDISTPLIPDTGDSFISTEIPTDTSTQTQTPTPTPPTEKESPTPTDTITPTSTPPTNTPSPTPTNTPTPPSTPTQTPTPPPTSTPPTPTPPTPTPTPPPVKPPDCIGNPGNAKCAGKSGEFPNGNPEQYNAPPQGPGIKGSSDGIKQPNHQIPKIKQSYYRLPNLIMLI